MYMATVMLDASHGGNDLGNVYGRRYEKDDTLKLTQAIGEQLMNRGIRVLYTRSMDLYKSPLQRLKYANDEKVDLFLTIHRASAGIPNNLDGVRAFAYDMDSNNIMIANNILSELEKLGFRNIGIGERVESVILRKNNNPALWLDVGFIDSDKDNQYIDNNLEEVASAIADGIEASLNMSQDSEDLNMQSSINNEGINERVSQYPCSCMQNTKASIVSQSENMRYRVQVGLFRSCNDALNLQLELVEQGYIADIVKQGVFYAVHTGNYDNIDDAAVLARSLAMNKYDTLLVSVEY
jgi:N-acetylmuramoyl-L-alanine amidase